MIRFDSNLHSIRINLNFTDSFGTLGKGLSFNPTPTIIPIKIIQVKNDVFSIFTNGRYGNGSLLGG